MRKKVTSRDIGRSDITEDNVSKFEVIKILQIKKKQGENKIKY